MKNIWSSMLLELAISQLLSTFIRKISDKITAASYIEKAVDYLWYLFH